MNLDLHPTPTSNTCTECGEHDFVLCVDQTAYYTAKLTQGGSWFAQHTHNETIDNDGAAVRLMCAECGTYFHVPDDFDHLI